MAGKQKELPVTVSELWKSNIDLPPGYVEIVPSVDICWFPIIKEPVTVEAIIPCLSHKLDLLLINILMLSKLGPYLIDGIVLSL